MAQRPWYRGLFGPTIAKLQVRRSGTRLPKGGAQSYRPTLEVLEDRRVPSAGVPSLTATGVFPVTPMGTQYLSTTANGKSVAAEPDGRTVLTWTSPTTTDGPQVFARVYNADGTPLAGPIVVNQDSNVEDEESSIAVDGLGNFVISWQGGYGGSHIFARRFSPAGQALSDEFQVDHIADGGQSPIVVMDQAGEFVIVWQNFFTDASNHMIYAQHFGTSGQAWADPLQVSAVPNSFGTVGMAVAMDAQGDFIVAWADAEPTGSVFDHDIFARRFVSSGASGSTFQVAQFTAVTQNQPSPSAAMDDQGNFVIAWASNVSNQGPFEIYAQRYTASGQAVGDVLLVAEQEGFLYGRYQTNAAMDAQGNFVVSWAEADDNVSSGSLFARRFDATGTPLSDTFQVEQSNTAAPISPSVVIDAAGDLIFSWTQGRLENTTWAGVNGQGPAYYPALFAIFGARYDAAAPPTIPVDADPAPNTVAVGAANGDTVGVTASSTDPNGLPITYSLDDDAGGRFVIDPKTGVVTIVNAAFADTPAIPAQAPGIPVYPAGETPANSPLDVAPPIPLVPGENINPITVRASDGTNSSTAEFLIAFPSAPQTILPPVIWDPLPPAPSPFQYDAATQSLVISATLSQNLFTFSQATTVDASGTLHTVYAFTLNGVTRTCSDAEVTHVEVIGVNATSSATLITNDTYRGADAQEHETAETVVLGNPDVGNGAGQILKQDAAGNWVPFLNLTGFFSSYAYVGHADMGKLYASPGLPNEFVTAGAYSYMAAQGEFHLISGAANVYGYSANLTDLAWHYDTAAMDAFVSSGNAYSYLSGTDNGQTFFNEAVGFATTYALATHGLSIAYFVDSPGTNVFFGATPYSYLSGTNSDHAFFDEAQGFALVYAASSEGETAFAYNHDPGHNLLSGDFVLLA